MSPGANQQDDLLFAATKSGVLQDMRDSCSIRRVCLETYAKNIISIFPCDMQVVCICFVMLQQHSRQMQLGDVFLLLHSKPAELLSNVREIFEICHC